ncbi:MAG TPA: P-II family nitrogen regulator [Balneolales bacterium]|nr:P-II family nitrogen regulator [Balneolales bacterium]
MKLLVYILNNPELLDETLEVFVEMGVRGATVIDSVGMGHILTQDVPIFAGLQLLLPNSKPGNKTILTLVDDKQVDIIVKEIERISGSDIDDPGTGIIFVLPVEQVYGLAQSNLE